MGVRSKSGKLFFDFRWRGRRCREFTGLADTKENRRRAEAFLKVIQGQIKPSPSPCPCPCPNLPPGKGRGRGWGRG
jgi:hypothetical protein